eukprot:ANDGO_04932.mRNA.1 hypothetical protein
MSTVFSTSQNVVSRFKAVQNRQEFVELMNECLEIPSNLLPSFASEMLSYPRFFDLFQSAICDFESDSISNSESHSHSRLANTASPSTTSLSSHHSNNANDSDGNDNKMTGSIVYSTYSASEVCCMAVAEWVCASDSLGVQNLALSLMPIIIRESLLCRNEAKACLDACVLSLFNKIVAESNSFSQVFVESATADPTRNAAIAQSGEVTTTIGAKPDIQQQLPGSLVSMYSLSAKAMVSVNATGGLPASGSMVYALTAGIPDMSVPSVFHSEDDKVASRSGLTRDRLEAHNLASLSKKSSGPPSLVSGQAATGARAGALGIATGGPGGGVGVNAASGFSIVPAAELPETTRAIAYGKIMLLVMERYAQFPAHVTAEWLRTWCRVLSVGRKFDFDVRNSKSVPFLICHHSLEAMAELQVALKRNFQHNEATVSEAAVDVQLQADASAVHIGSVALVPIAQFAAKGLYSSKKTAETVDLSLRILQIVHLISWQQDLVHILRLTTAALESWCDVQQSLPGTHR